MDESICSFCAKKQSEVKKLISGPNTYICNECVALCNDIIAEDTTDGGVIVPNLPQVTLLSRFPEIDAQKLNEFIASSFTHTDPFGEQTKTVGDFLDAYVDAGAKTQGIPAKPMRHLEPTPELIKFARLLAIFTDTGVPLMYGLRALLNGAGDLGKLTTVIPLIIDRISDGSSLAQAIEPFDECFDDLFCHMVRAGEASGELQKTLIALADLMMFERSLHAKDTAPLDISTALIFLKTMTTLLEAGLPLVTSLDITASLLPPNEYRPALQSARKKVALHGMSLADALATSGAFSPLIIVFVRTGETAGTLSTTLAKLTHHLQVDLGF